ncbi:uncharacterized protein [Pempheris klunzingeri]|uniref:uncharacterized protein n=1 Tax=Pempheris klunzingeri TaxID=3127111 RepID=UPI0039801AC0
MLLLLSCWIIAGITAEGPPTPHRPHQSHQRVTNSSICLKVKKSPSQGRIEWSFGSHIIAYDNTVNPKYKDKVDYYPQNNTLCINKLNETDNGIYTVSITDSFHKSTETHELIVHEAVPRPVIKMFVMPTSNLSAGLCNIEVNCSIQDDWVLSVCDGHSCRTVQESLRKVNISIFTNNRSVVCTGSNLVSTKNASESIDTTCVAKSNRENEDASQPPAVIIIVVITIIAIVVCVSFCTFIVFVAKGIFSKEHNHHQAQASPAQLIRSREAEEQPQPAHRDSTSSSSSSQAEVSYENVEAIQPCQTNSQREELESKESQKVDTIYSSLQAPNATPPSGKTVCSKNAKGDKEVRQASTSQSVVLDEDPTQIDTVYSMLQDPKKSEVAAPPTGQTRFSEAKTMNMISDRSL